MIKSPHRISLVDGELREESGLELQGDQVVAAKHVARFEQSGGAPVAGPLAGAGAAAGRVDMHGDPVVQAGAAAAVATSLPRADASAQELEAAAAMLLARARSEEHTSELQSLMRISYAVFCLKKKNNKVTRTIKP